MKSQIAGIKFAVNANPDLALMRPEGLVMLKHEPFVHPKLERFNDPDAVRVYLGDLAIGYLPQKGPERKAAWAYAKANNEMPTATIDGYAYSTGKNNFNQDHEGILAAVTLELAVESEEESGKKSGDFEFYEKDGKQYLRATNVLKHFDPEASPRLRNWMIDTFACHDDYDAYMGEAADKGTKMHDGNEAACIAGVVGAKGSAIEEAIKAIPQEKYDRIPAGFWNFISKETAGFEFVSSETTVYDDISLTAGTYDLKLKSSTKTIIVDWKSSKQVFLKQLIQGCFYAHCEDADEVWIVAFGSKKVCGYQCKPVIGKHTIALGYNIVRGAAIALHVVTDFKAAMKGAK